MTSLFITIVGSLIVLCICNMIHSLKFERIYDIV